jgi:hypothetical protein
MYVIVEQIGAGSRIILDRGCMAKIGIAETGAQVADVEVVGDALVIRSVPAEHRAAAMEKAEAVRDEWERRWQEAMLGRGGQRVEPT